MAPDSRSPSPKATEFGFDVPPKEDAETTAAREELRNTSISELDKASRRSRTPDADPEKQQTSLKNLVSSPKKKRAHDQLDTGDSIGTKKANIGNHHEVMPPIHSRVPLLSTLTRGLEL